MVSRSELRQIRALVPDQRAMREARDRWDRVAMPLDGLGILQDDLIRMAGILGDADHLLELPRLLVMCADNGVVAEGVSQTGPETTALVADSIAGGESPSAIFAAQCDCQLRVVDVGMVYDAKNPAVVCDKVARGSRNFAQSWPPAPREQKRVTPVRSKGDFNGGAMTEAETLAAISVGMKEAVQAKEEGVGLLLTGEMGIGNTTTSAACLAALLNLPTELVVGRGAGLSDLGLARKREVIDCALKKMSLHASVGHTDPLEVLCRVGGFDIAALSGLILGANQTRIPVLLDGLIASVAALIADRLCPGARGVCLASHLGREPGMTYAIQALHLKPVIHADLALGEGTGALLALRLLQSAACVYTSTKTFEKLGMDAYQRKEI